MSKEELTKEQEEAFENVLILLKGMLQDRSVHRNIKRLAQKGITIINGGNDSPGILASNVMYLVGDLTGSKHSFCFKNNSVSNYFYLRDN